MPGRGQAQSGVPASYVATKIFENGIGDSGFLSGGGSSAAAVFRLLNEYNRCQSIADKRGVSGVGDRKDESPLAALLLSNQRATCPIDDAFRFPGSNNQFQ